MEFCGFGTLTKIDIQQEIKVFYEYKDLIDGLNYFAYLLKKIGKTYTKLLFFYFCQICFSDMDFDEDEKSGLDSVAYLQDLDKRQRLTIKQFEVEMKLTEVQSFFLMNNLGAHSRKESQNSIPDFL